MIEPFAVTLGPGSSRSNRTGSWRSERPVYVDRVAPCGHACPAGEDVRDWLYVAQAGEPAYEAAWRRIMDDNPLPAVLGRVCYHPCESSCNRSELDGAVGINSVERFLGDLAIERGWQVEADKPSTGLSVLVVGSGPAGLSAAYHLVRLGHAVTVRDQAPRPGGMMRYGIPRYRLPREVLDAEIQRIVDLGVALELGAPVTDLESERRDFDAVFLAVGAQLDRRAEIPAATAARVLEAVGLLHGLEDDGSAMLGRRVAVYGGGDTALDVARTARRLGAYDPVVIYRRTREQMPAHESELREALDEGITFRWLSTVARVLPDRLVVERMELDENGFPQPTGELDELAADSLVLALGQDTDLALLDRVPELRQDHGRVEVDETLSTVCPGVFAGGDMVPQEQSVTSAVGQGARAARSIDRWLAGLSTTTPNHGEVPALATTETLNTWYYDEVPRTHRPRLDPAVRAETFDEVVTGLDAASALEEARRCLSCGQCLGCDNCFGVCPDDAIIKIGPPGPGGYLIDLDFCKGCGLCVQECPPGAIQMFPEDG
ncbi:NAD(P)-binding protein [Nocardioides bigeumensis]|uniref:NAD(P)-binding protein n=1 Tax=Nocardioides bigeumensis TaxID=433657 RepID=A0ABN2Y548_9ACTN